MSDVPLEFSNYTYTVTATNAAGSNSDSTAVTTPDSLPTDTGWSSNVDTVGIYNSPMYITNAATDSAPAEPVWYVLTRAGDPYLPLTVTLNMTGDAEVGTDYALASPYNSSPGVDGYVVPSGSGFGENASVTFAPGQEEAVVEVDPLNGQPRSGKLLTATIATGGYNIVSYANQRTVDMDPHGLAIKLDNGELDPVLAATPDAPTNPLDGDGAFYNLDLTIPDDAPYGSQVTLSVDNQNAVYLWTGDNGAPALLNLTSSGTYTWTLGTGSGAPPDQLLVQGYCATSASQTATFSLVYTTNTAQVKPPNPVTETASTYPATIQPTLISAPINLSATYQTQTAPGEVRLSWAASRDKVDGYQIFGTVGPDRIQGLEEVSATTTSFIYHPSFTGTYQFYIEAERGGNVSDASNMASCRAIGGPDITTHLIAIEAHLAAISHTPAWQNISDAWNSLNWTQHIGDWDIIPLYHHNVSDATNSGLLPDNTPSVTVNGQVYYDSDVNYWLYGVWARLEHASLLWSEAKIFGYRIAANAAFSQNEDIEGRLNWFLAGYSGALSSSGGLNAAPAKDDPGAMEWHVTIDPTYWYWD